MAEEAVFDGTLIRVGPDEWEWSDGTPAPEVYDLHPDHEHNYRVRNYADASFVEVPIRDIYEDPELEWIQDWYDRGELDVGLSGDKVARSHMREILSKRGIVDAPDGDRVILVPIDAWDIWNSYTVIGAGWDEDDISTREIVEKAESLGARIPGWADRWWEDQP